MRELLRCRELLFFLVWRDVKIRYKQTLLGAAWAVLQPLLTMIVFGLVAPSFFSAKAPAGTSASMCVTQSTFLRANGRESPTRSRT